MGVGGGVDTAKKFAAMFVCSEATIIYNQPPTPYTWIF